MMVIGLDQNR